MPGTVADVHAEEVCCLMPLGRPFDSFVEQTKRVSPTCLIAFERNRYSVPASFANRPVSLRIYPDRLFIAAEGQILCEHSRLIDRSHNKPGRTIYDWRHYLAVVQRKPGASRNGAHSWKCLRPSGSCRPISSGALAETGRWWRSCLSFCIMTSRLS